MVNTFIAGTTAITIPASILKTLGGLAGFSVKPYGTATATTDSAGDLVADFAVTGGRKGNFYNVIEHEGSGFTISDSHGSVTFSDFRIDGLNNVVYGNIAITVDKVTTTYIDSTLFKIGSNGSLTATASVTRPINIALGTSLPSSLAFGSAAPSPIANPLSPVSEESASFVSLFNDSGFQGLTQPIVDGTTNLAMTTALTNLGFKITSDSTGNTITNGVVSFLENGGTETAAGYSILNQNQGLSFSRDGGTVDFRNFLFDTINHVVDVDVYVNNVFKGNAAEFNLAANGTMTFDKAGADLLDASFGITGVSDGTVFGAATLHPFTLTHLEAQQILAVTGATPAGSTTGPGA